MKFQVVEKIEQCAAEGGYCYKLVLRGNDNNKEPPGEDDIRGRIAYQVTKQVFDSVRLGQDAEVEVRFIPILRAIP